MNETLEKPPKMIIKLDDIQASCILFLDIMTRRKLSKEYLNIDQLK
jgi:hypothetical protein